ncbi:hypothetical protein OUZ56_012591 [Daphnia magna]|uniref:Uncharacterized protein n=1 Tax=Daphnia magna TaxID=35525 RepID=A0ABQ9Z3L5_9CRUS|nr:hypothetical protein OUZ56_012591 [Daphnia magna]
MTVYIGSKRKLAIRWKAKNPNHTSSWNLIRTDGEAGKFSSEKRLYEDIEQELAETDVKIVKLEQDNRKLKQNVLAI